MLVVVAGASDEVVRSALKHGESDGIVYVSAPGPETSYDMIPSIEEEMKFVPEDEAEYYLASSNSSHKKFLEALARRYKIPLALLSLEFFHRLIGYRPPEETAQEYREHMSLFSSMLKRTLTRESVTVRAIIPRSPIPIGQIVGTFLQHLGVGALTVTTYYEWGRDRKVYEFSTHFGKLNYSLSEPDALFLLLCHLVESDNRSGRVRQPSLSNDKLAVVLQKSDELSRCVPPVRGAHRGYPGWVKRFRQLSRAMAQDGVFEATEENGRREVYTLTSLGMSLAHVAILSKEALPSSSKELIDAIGDIRATLEKL